MKTLLKCLAAGAIFATSLWASAADISDPVVGTWKLNGAKSTHSAVAYKSETRTYTAAPDGIALTWERIAADGKRSTVKTTYKYDGQDYPVTGSTDFDSISAKRVDANTVDTIEKRNGKEVGTTRRSVSKDGKTLMLNQRFKPATGPEFGAMMVYDRQ